ncbi:MULTISPECIES: dsDNA nuclease domain-containing protein [Niastella]|uniref:CD-NTase associated protein 4-like DNA endonuclease domain-containing protein n=1 Tax=Niastella soli TaxID=2821487 RepID=A0ABS3Z225_9BACT|nr:hypothetical protein [Niastella soli]MBO9204203.1 hypothetical protein [Niastella soli]
MRKNKKVTKSKRVKIVSEPERLEVIMEGRTGGSINFRGVDFQTIYAVYAALSHLEPGGTRQVHFEGLEDLDMIDEHLAEHIQVKTSVNPINANALWGLKVLQNFFEVYQKAPTAKFRLVHNSSFSKGNLEIFSARSFPADKLAFWKEKFNGDGLPVSSDELKSFFRQITIEQITTEQLENEIRKLLYQRYEVNNQAERAFLKSLFYHVFQWSKKRQTASVEDVVKVIQMVKDEHAKFPVNPAVQHDWIKEVSYNESDTTAIDEYYEGKAARPVHIAMGLPVRRQIWEEAILNGLASSKVTVIISSSGQGKSTLAWQVGQIAAMQGDSVYRLNSCRSWEQATAVYDFIETRLRIGQTPLIIIDGLDSGVQGWQELAGRMSDLPVKLLITAREEDWVRYGGDVSKVTIEQIPIKLSIGEAETIYEGLDRMGKIHKDIHAWQPAWEQTHSKGLLIEYVYLLTKGEMITERLAHQVKVLQREQGSAAKLEVLRLICLADILNVKLRTDRLTRFIQQTVRFEGDRNEVYRQLEKEYYLKFDSIYVEGLHPVRSKHMVDILHSHISLNETLLSVLQVVEGDKYYDFFIGSPFLVRNEGKDDYYKEAARIIGSGHVINIVSAIDGLMHFEPGRFWIHNQRIFDEVFVTGGIELFVTDTFPFNQGGVLQKFPETHVETSGGNIKYLQQKGRELPVYSYQDSAIINLVRHLGAILKERTNVKWTKGVFYLYKWFDILGVVFPDIVEMDDQYLLTALEKEAISDAADLFRFYRAIRPAAYQQFISRHRETVIAWIKRKSAIISLTENGNDVRIGYLFYQDYEKANEESMVRINIVHAFFGDYERYCTEISQHPLFNDHLYAVAKQFAEKALPKDQIPDDFAIHINQIWKKTILLNYSSASVYEWQKQFFDFRFKAVSLVKTSLKVFEAYLSRDATKIDVASKRWMDEADKFLNDKQRLKQFPYYTVKYFEESSNQDEQQINTFFASFGNFINQMPGIFLPDEDKKRRLSIYNLRSAVCSLAAMQKSYQAILGYTHAHFCVDKLSEEEELIYSKLLKTSQFYAHLLKGGSTEKYPNPSRFVEAWWQADRKGRLDRIHAIIRGYEKVSSMRFLLPSETIEEENLTGIIIGVKNCNLYDDNNNSVYHLILGLRELGKAEIDYVTFLFLNEKNEIVEVRRVYKRLFERMMVFAQTKDLDIDGNGNLIIQENVSDSFIGKVRGQISLLNEEADEQDQRYVLMMLNIWQLSAYRSNLSNHPVEREWLAALEGELKPIILQHFTIVWDNPKRVYLPGKAEVQKFLDGEVTFSFEQIRSYIEDCGKAFGKESFV